MFVIFSYFETGGGGGREVMHRFILSVLRQLYGNGSCLLPPYVLSYIETDSVTYTGSVLYAR